MNLATQQIKTRAITTGGHHAVNEVYKTHDYDKFKQLDGNRSLRMPHVKALQKAMSEKYLQSPIIVNEKMYVIDGQHRLAAASALKLPVFYIIMKGYGLAEMQTLNQNNKVWTGWDFVNCYADLGYPDYVTFREFQKKYKFGQNECTSLLTGIQMNGSGNVSTLIKQGEFKIASLAYAEQMAVRVISCGQYYDGFRRRSFIYALMTLTKNEDFSFEEFLEKLKLQRSKMYNCASASQYIALIEEIYNYRRQKKVNLRF